VWIHTLGEVDNFYATSAKFDGNMILIKIILFNKNSNNISNNSSVVFSSSSTF